MAKASNKKMDFISLYVHLPREPCMVIFLELINKLESSKWGVGDFQNGIIKKSLSHSEKPKQNFFQKD